jgi:hypothetical protein
MSGVLYFINPILEPRSYAVYIHFETLYYENKDLALDFIFLPILFDSYVKF